MPAAILYYAAVREVSPRDDPRVILLLWQRYIHPGYREITLVSKQQFSCLRVYEVVQNA